MLLSCEHKTDLEVLYLMNKIQLTFIPRIAIIIILIFNKLESSSICISKFAIIQLVLKLSKELHSNIWPHTY